MTAQVPKVVVIDETTQLINRPGMASKIAVIGAFKTGETNPKLFTSVGEAYEEFGNDDTFNGCSVVPYLFEGASTLLAVNFTTVTTTGSGEQETTTYDKTLTTAKLSSCLAKIKGEDWDILYVAEVLTDEFLAIIDAYLDDCYEIKCPAGFIGALNGSSSSANITSAGLIGSHCYGVIVQSLEVNGESLNLIKSSAYYAGVIAGMNVGNTMTMKTVDGVTGVSPEFTFETGDTGKAYLEAGITTFKCQNRNSKRFVVVNSEQPNGYDLYINRVKDFVIKEFALHKFLGDRNRQATYTEIDHELGRVKDLCVNSLDLLEDITYSIQKEGPQCVGILIDSLLFAGIITRINVYVKLEVE